MKIYSLSSVPLSDNTENLLFGFSKQENCYWCFTIDNGKIYDTFTLLYRVYNILETEPYLFNFWMHYKWHLNSTHWTYLNIPGQVSLHWNLSNMDHRPLNWYLLYYWFWLVGINLICKQTQTKICIHLLCSAFRLVSEQIVHEIQSSTRVHPSSFYLEGSNASF